jgi:heptosyltransferase III
LRVLILRAGALGDLLLLRRTIAALKNAGRSVGLLAPSGPAAALVGSGPADADEVLPWESAALAGLFGEGSVEEPMAARLRRYDAAIACTRDAALVRNLRRLVPMVLQHDPQPPRGGMHASDWIASCLPSIGVAHGRVNAPPLEADVADRRRADGIADGLPAQFLALHPGSGSPAKNWPAERFASLARSHGGGRWLLVRGPADDSSAAVLETVEGAVVARDLPLRVLAALLARAGAYVGNDSGVTHLAAATGAPTIALFGATDPGLWAPVGRRVEVLAGATMDAIAYEDVAAAVERARALAR